MTIHSETINVTLFGLTTSAQIEIEDTWRSNIDFNCLSQSYSFSITSWSGRGLANFITLFHSSIARDPVQFGTLTIDTNGNTMVQMTRTQKVKMMTQACRDVMACLDLIGKRYARCILDYAVWYRERHQERSTYSQYITLVCAHCIVHADFLAPNVAWDLVTFSERSD
jgi:hypothetical protein